MSYSGAPKKNYIVNKFGRNNAIGANDESIWTEGGLYSWPGSAQTMKLSSDVHAKDVGGVNSFGDGAHAVRVSGLDGDYLEVNEIVTLDGSSGTETATQFIRINRMEVVSAGVNRKNGGTVYIGEGALTSGKPNTVFSIIDSGEGQTRCGFYTIPASYYAYLFDYNFSVGGGGNIESKIYVTELNGPRNVKVSDETTGNPVDKKILSTDEYPPKSDIEMVAFRTSGAAASVSGRFDLFHHYGRGR